jgi:hypothetical protein
MNRDQVKALLYRLAPLFVFAVLVAPKSWRW